jgi:hypothetical protein
MNGPRDHHFIPAFYLRQWCSGTGKLIEYTIKQGNLISKPVGPTATGYEFDLYAFPELPPDQSQFIEQQFFEYADRKAADALQLHLANAAGWTRELRSAWSRFLIALHLRHPDTMPELRAAAQALWDGSGKASQQAYDRIRQPGDPDRFDEYLARRDPLVPVKARVNLIVKTFDNEILGTHINKMKWAVIDLCSAPHRLLTSDRPVGLFNIREPTGIITLPISPTKLFIAVNDQRAFDHLGQMKPRDIVAHVNTRLVTRARRFVWADNQSQTPFIKKHMSTKLESTPFFPNIGNHYDTASPLEIEALENRTK